VPGVFGLFPGVRDASFLCLGSWIVCFCIWLFGAIDFCMRACLHGVVVFILCSAIVFCECRLGVLVCVWVLLLWLR